jgi:heptosyltransferase-2
MLKADRILVIRYRFIGDTILTVPFLRNLRAAYPDATIDVLVGPQSGKVLEGCPYINDLIEFDTTRFHKYDSGDSQKRHFLSYVFQLRKRRYDTAFVLKRSLSSALLSFLIGAKNRIGYSMPGRNFLLTKTIPWKSDKHEVISTLDVLSCANIPVIDDHLEAWISSAELAQIDQIVPQLKTDSRYYLIHAAAAHPDKLYPLDSWSKIITSLYEEAQLVPVFSGAQADHALYESLSSQAGVNSINLAGKLSLRQSMALYKRLRFSICVDSGPAHLSAAVGTPTLAIFGPTDPVRWRPYGPQHKALYDAELACRPCHYKKTCVDRPCLTQLSPERVLEQAMLLWRRSHETVSC